MLADRKKFHEQERIPIGLLRRPGLEGLNKFKNFSDCARCNMTSVDYDTMCLTDNNSAEITPEGHEPTV